MAASSSSAAAAGLLLLVLLAMVLSNEAEDQRPKTLRRRKRAWIRPPTKLKENVDYTQKTSIAKIHSDQKAHTKVKYYLTGPGADEPPVNLFVVDRDTGFVHITGIVDREKYPFFNLTGIAKYPNGTLAETGISLYVTILDINDNAPRFEPQSGEVLEGSREGTFVMQIEGKDDDQPGTINSTISYSIISQQPEGLGHMFWIDEQTGKLYVKKPALDRETVELYRLVVQGVDLGGAAGGLKGSGTVEIRVLDINDNVPTLEQCEYSASVDENVHNVVVSRIKARDRDLEHTDNWHAVFVIARGNEDNLFAIETDENTNEGVLTLIKPLDFEEVQNLELTLLIRNVAPFTTGEAVMMDVGVRVGEGEPLAPTSGPGGGGPVKGGVDVESARHHPRPTAGGGGCPEGYVIRITVNNVAEDPAFIPAVREITVSEDPEDQPKDGIIMVFTAVDPDTGKAAHVRYAKASDPGNWFTVDKHTAEIKLNKRPDRESALVVNGRYVAKIVAISNEHPSATATGTIIIRVADANDHCPTLTSTHSSLCADRKTVYITAMDKDASPNAAPFTFTVIPEGSRGSWDIEVINETTAALHSQKNLWPGIYKLQVMLADAQGRSCPAHEEYTLHVCTCTRWEMCHPGRRATSSSKLSAAAIGLLLLPAGLLLLVPLLLLFCQCGGANTIFPGQFIDLPFQATEHLMSYHTEGKGTDQEVPLKSIPVMPESKMGTPAKRQQSPNTEVIKTDPPSWNSWSWWNSDFGKTHRVGAGRTALFEHIALPKAFLKAYYAQRAAEAAPVKDGLLDFTFEGQGSSAGSLSCCSLRDPQDDLGFLDDLSTKFKTLAEVCSPAQTPAAAAAAATPTPARAALTHHVADAASTCGHVDHAVRPRRGSAGRAETLVSSSAASTASVSGVSTSPAWVDLPGTEAVTVSQSSNLSQAAALLPGPQTVLLQQQPVYCARTILQPVQYVVQPRVQKVVLLADQACRANDPGLFVVQGSKNPAPPSLHPLQGCTSGIVVQASKPSKNLQGRASPTSPAGGLNPNPNPVSPGVAPTFVSLQGWKAVVPDPQGKPSSASPDVADRGPLSSQGSLHRSAKLAKKAAAPQGRYTCSLGRVASPAEEKRLPKSGP